MDSQQTLTPGKLQFPPVQQEVGINSAKEGSVQRQTPTLWPVASEPVDEQDPWESYLQ